MTNHALFYSHNLTAPKSHDEVKPAPANKPRRGSREPPPKPPTGESDAPKEQPIKEETKPHIPPGAKQVSYQAHEQG